MGHSHHWRQERQTLLEGLHQVMGDPFLSHLCEASCLRFELPLAVKACRRMVELVPWYWQHHLLDLYIVLSELDSCMCCKQQLTRSWTCYTGCELNVDCFED